MQAHNEIARRKMHMTWDETHALLSLIQGLLPLVPLTVETHETGLALANRHGLRIYDAMFTAAALLAHCETLWSEDMPYVLVINGQPRVADPTAV